MDLNRVLAELAKERDLIDEAIAHLERLSPNAHNASSRRRPAEAEKPLEKARAAGA